MWVYNLTFVIHTRKQSPKNVFIYSWLESQRGKGSNEVCSALQNLLIRLKRRIETHRYKELHLFADSCAGQNKNLSMVALLLTYLNSPLNKYFEEIKFFWPIRGHSYLPADQVFGRIERELKKKVTVLSPEEYYEVYRRYGRVKLFPQDFQVFDYKRLADTILRKNCLQSRQTRQWSFKKSDPKKIFVSDRFFGNETAVSIFRPKLQPLKSYKPLLLPKQSFVKDAKKEDVRSLLSHFTLSEEQKRFYDENL